MTDATQPKQPAGDFYAPLNRYKQAGDSKPMFSGTLTKPGEDAKLPFALWAFEYETTNKDTGEVIKRRGFGGSISGIPTNLPAQDMIEALMRAPEGTEAQVANLMLRPGQVVLFENGFKDEAPEKNRPNYWGYVNPTDGSPVFRPSVWLKTYADSNTPYLSGTTQYPLPGKSERDQQEAAPHLDQLIQEGTVTKGMPRTRKSRGEAEQGGRA